MSDDATPIDVIAEPVAPPRPRRGRPPIYDPNAPPGSPVRRPLNQQSVHERRARAYRILGVDPNMVAFVAQFTPFFRRIPGGIPAAMELLRTCDLPEARAFITRYDDITMPVLVRETLPLEAFAIAANVTGEQIISAVVSTARIRSAQEGSMLAAAAHPAIVAASSEFAQLPEGTEHAMANLKHMGFLPTSQGSRVSVQVNASATAQSAAAARQSLPAPSPEASIRRMVKSMRDVPQLAAAPADAIPVPQFNRDDAAAFVPLNAGHARREEERRYRDQQSAITIDGDADVADEDDS